MHQQEVARYAPGVGKAKEGPALEPVCSRHHIESFMKLRACHTQWQAGTQRTASSKKAGNHETCKQFNLGRCPSEYPRGSCGAATCSQRGDTIHARDICGAIGQRFLFDGTFRLLHLTLLREQPHRTLRPRPRGTPPRRGAPRAPLAFGVRRFGAAENGRSWSLPSYVDRARPFLFR